MFRFTDVGSRSKPALLGLLAAVILCSIVYFSAVELDHRSRARAEGQERPRVDVVVGDPATGVLDLSDMPVMQLSGRQTETDGRLATLWASVFGVAQPGTQGGRQAPEPAAVLTTVGVSLVVLLGAVLLGVRAVRRGDRPSSAPSAPSARRAPAPAPMPSLVLSSV
ncbi:MAG: hypothetical protein M3442_03030, partial [Chloroflexota bacterium]|nr:hypothetical protein [Chloroflexota bacterium]